MNFIVMSGVFRKNVDFGKGPITGSLALELLSVSQPEFSAAFRGSPVKRPTRRGLALGHRDRRRLQRLGGREMA